LPLPFIYEASAQRLLNRTKLKAESLIRSGSSGAADFRHAAERHANYPRYGLNIVGRATIRMPLDPSTLCSLLTSSPQPDRFLKVASDIRHCCRRRPNSLQKKCTYHPCFWPRPWPSLHWPLAQSDFFRATWRAPPKYSLISFPLLLASPPPVTSNPKGKAHGSG
jgi:hypothetical protein